MINHVAIDPNGVCNAKCWFCPIRYDEDRAVPEEMSVADLESIFNKVASARDSGTFGNDIYIHTAMYNEIILYRHWDKFLELASNYKLKIILYTNGIALNKKRIDELKQFEDAVELIVFNIPAFEKELWGNYMGVNPELFDNLLQNIHYLNSQDLTCTTTTVVNSMFEDVVKNDFINHNRLGDIVEYVSDKTWDEQIELAKNLSLPNTSKGEWVANRAGNVPVNMPNVSKGEWVANRAGNVPVEMSNVSKGEWVANRAGNVPVSMSNVSKGEWVANRAGNIPVTFIEEEESPVIGCTLGKADYGDNRVHNWMNIDPRGDIVVCGEDYYQETSLGNIHDFDDLSVWYNSEARLKGIEQAHATLCRRCVWAER